MTHRLITRFRILLVATVLASCGHSSFASGKPECIAPAMPGGGFDVTCELVRAGLQATQAFFEPVRTTYMPGGVGAVTFNAVIAHRNAEPDTFVAFSGGSLFNIAQGRFGKYTERDVKWLAALGVDHGVLIVKDDSPYATLKDLVAALRNKPDGVVFGGSGTVGSQDWMKASLVAQAAGINFKKMRFVGFEGGGQANAALLGKHVDVVSGDASEAIGLIQNGAKLRILVVFASQRLPGKLKDVPTAKKAGYDIEWANMRGVYMGPKVADADSLRWVGIFNKMLALPAFDALREERGLQPLTKTGAELDALVQQTVKKYRELAFQSGLRIKSP
ncbi:MAG: tripartite tricarboxylate transporter substrate-binding protein [Polaromonas sp.]